MIYRKVYVGTSLLNYKRAEFFYKKLEQIGYEITYKWTSHGQLFDEEALAAVGKLEFEGVEKCDIFIMVQPGRGGTHCELGIALALNKIIIILEEVVVEQKTFYYLPGVLKCKTENELFKLLKGL